MSIEGHLNSWKFVAPQNKSDLGLIGFRVSLPAFRVQAPAALAAVSVWRLTVDFKKHYAELNVQISTP